MTDTTPTALPLSLPLSHSHSLSHPSGPTSLVPSRLPSLSASEVSPSESESFKTLHRHDAEGVTSSSIIGPSHANEYERSPNDIEAGMASTDKEKVARAREEAEGTVLSEPETKAPDPNMVTWDGADDP
jgi:hypothetical protein